MIWTSLMKLHSPYLDNDSTTWITLYPGGLALMSKYKHTYWHAGLSMDGDHVWLGGIALV